MGRMWWQWRAPARRTPRRAPCREALRGFRKAVGRGCEGPQVFSKNEKGPEIALRALIKKVGRRSPRARSRMPTLGALPRGGKPPAPRRHSRRQVLVAVSWQDRRRRLAARRVSSEASGRMVRSPCGGRLLHSGEASLPVTLRPFSRGLPCGANRRRSPRSTGLASYLSGRVSATRSRCLSARKRFTAPRRRCEATSLVARRSGNSLSPPAPKSRSERALLAGARLSRSCPDFSR